MWNAYLFCNALLCLWETRWKKEPELWQEHSWIPHDGTCVHTVHYRSEVSWKKNSGVPQAPYNPASLIGHFPVSMNESLFKSMWKCKKKVEHVDQIPSNHVWNCGKNENLNGIILLMQQWAFLEGITFNKICFTFYVLFNQSKNFLNRSHVLEWIHHFDVEVWCVKEEVGICMVLWWGVSMWIVLPGGTVNTWVQPHFAVCVWLGSSTCGSVHCPCSCRDCSCRCWPVVTVRTIITPA